MDKHDTHRKKSATSRTLQ